MNFKYFIENEGEAESGLPSYTETVTVHIDSDNLIEVSEFAEFMESCLEDWYDGSTATLVDSDAESIICGKTLEERMLIKRLHKDNHLFSVAYQEGFKADDYEECPYPFPHDINNNLIRISNKPELTDADKQELKIQREELASTEYSKWKLGHHNRQFTFLY